MLVFIILCEKKLLVILLEITKMYSMSTAIKCFHRKNHNFYLKKKSSLSRSLINLRKITSWRKSHRSWASIEKNI